jgi:hypothetical protein
MTAATAEPAPDHVDVGRLRDAAKQLGMKSISDGSWFRRLVTNHVKAHAAKVDPKYFERVYDRLPVEDRATLEIRKVAVRAAAAGVAGSAGASAGELLALFTDGLALPIGLPAMLASMLIEGSYTAMLQIDLACDLGLIYGIPFDPSDVGEIATLFGLALNLDVYPKRERAELEEEKPKGLTSQLMHLEEGEIATRIGRKMLEDAIVRNVLPIVGMPLSARFNYVATMTLGTKVRKYMRYRRAVKSAVGQLRLGAVVDPTVLVEGAWLLATVDGDAGHEEMLALSAVMDLLTAEQRSAIAADKAFGDDEEGWFEDLRKVDHKMFTPLLDTLFLIAAADRELAVPERRFLRRISKTLGRDVDFSRIEQICHHLASGESPPSGWTS